MMLYDIVVVLVILLVLLGIIVCSLLRKNVCGVPRYGGTIKSAVATDESIIEQAMKANLFIDDSGELAEYKRGPLEGYPSFSPSGATGNALELMRADTTITNPLPNAVRAYNIDMSKIKVVDSLESINEFSDEFGVRLVTKGKENGLPGEPSAVSTVDMYGIDWPAVMRKYSGFACDPYNDFVPHGHSRNEWYHHIGDARYFIWGQDAILGSRVLSSRKKVD